MGIRGELFSSRATSRKRTYFFNVKENRNGDLFLNVVESTKHGETEFERRSLIIYAEDIESFVSELEKAVAFMRSKANGGR